jgi:deazaflavin-dependent oxidoreductase (nitroreductase family)
VPSVDDALSLGKELFCYLTTVGRVSGRPHMIEIWFALHDGTIFMLSGNRDRADWVRNALKQPRVTIRLGDRLFEADARIAENADEDALARRLLKEKYARPDASFADWVMTALPVAFDLISTAA